MMNSSLRIQAPARSQGQSSLVGSTPVAAAILIVCAACVTPLSGTDARPQLRIQVEPVVGALAEFADVADVGYGVSTTYAHPVADLGGHALYVESRVGLAWNEVYGTVKIPTIPPNQSTTIEVEDTASSIRVSAGAKLEFDTGSDDLDPYVSLGATYWSYDSDLGSVDAPGAYLGLGLDWSLSEHWFFGIGGVMNFLAANGAVEGLGIVPVVGLSVGLKF